MTIERAAFRFLKFTSVVAFCFGVVACTQADSPSDSRINELPMPSPAAIQKTARLPAPYNKGDVRKGRIAFGDCAECHSVALTE